MDGAGAPALAAPFPAEAELRPHRLPVGAGRARCPPTDARPRDACEEVREAAEAVAEAPSDVDPLAARRPLAAFRFLPPASRDATPLLAAFPRSLGAPSGRDGRRAVAARLFHLRLLPLGPVAGRVPTAQAVGAPLPLLGHGVAGQPVAAVDDVAWVAAEEGRPCVHHPPRSPRPLQGVHRPLLLAEGAPARAGGVRRAVGLAVAFGVAHRCGADDLEAGAASDPGDAA